MKKSKLTIILLFIFVSIIFLFLYGFNSLKEEYIINTKEISAPKSYREIYTILKKKYKKFKQK